MPTRQEDVVTTFFCLSQQRHMYVSDEISNDVSLERLQDVSVVCLHDVVKERRDNILRVRNNNVPLVSLHDVSN